MTPGIRRFVVCIVIAAAVAPTAAFAQSPAGPSSPAVSAAQLNGEWRGIVKLDNSSPHIALVFDVTDSTFAGEVFDDGDRMGPMEEGSFKGDKVHFKVGKFDFTGSMRGTSMSVDLIVYNGTVKSFTVTKVPEVRKPVIEHDHREPLRRGY